MLASKNFLPRFSPEFVAEAVGATVPGLPAPGAPPFPVITTDSRKITPGCLFVAIKGESFDGHSFIEHAIQQGARGVICLRGTVTPKIKGVFIYAVDDTLAAYRTLAARWRREFTIPVVAVAGSVGKTTTKEILASILGGKFSNVLKTTGSQNGFLGIPMTLLELRPTHQIAVIEVGIDEIGAMTQHMPLLGASAAVLTAIGPEHLEKLKDIPTVAREEGIAITHVSANGGIVSINLDDPWIRPHFNTLRYGQKIGFTLKLKEVQAPATAGAATGGTAAGGVTPQILRGQVVNDGAEIEVSGWTQGVETLPLPLPGAHNAANLLAALAVAVGLGLTPDEVRRGLALFQGASGRSELKEIQGKDGQKIPVVCDYYNANPTSMESGMELLTEISTRGGANLERWACLGDMLELGPNEEQFHRDLSRKILALSLENVLLYGPRMKSLHAELQAQGFKGHLEHFEAQDALASALAPAVDGGHSAILIKGSRGMKMEEIFKRLENAHPVSTAPASGVAAAV